MEIQANPQKKWYKKWWVIVIGILIGIIIFILIVGRGMPVLKDVPTEVTQSVLRVNGFGVENNATVKVYLNGDFVSEIKADSDGNFTTPVTLTEGKNSLYATAGYKDEEKKSSESFITYTNQEKTDAQNKAKADARAVTQEAQQKADDEAKITLEAQKKIDAEKKNTEVGGLGVSRSKAIAIMKICAPEYNFQEIAKIDGRENFIADTADRQGVKMQFLGSENNLYQIVAVTLLDTSDKEQVNHAFQVLGCFHGVLPVVEATKDWLIAELSTYLTKSISKDYTHTKVFDNRKYQFTSTVIGAFPSITLSVTVIE